MRTITYRCDGCKVKLKALATLYEVTKLGGLAPRHAQRHACSLGCLAAVVAQLRAEYEGETMGLDT